MVKAIMHDPMFLSQPSQAATKADLSVLTDLVDTLVYHRKECVGMAANMIGVTKRIIAVDCDGSYLVLFNPQILKASEPYEAEESCLSLLGGPRKTQRFRKIKLQYQTETFQTRIKTFEGWTAQIIQHEVDHCNGILI